MRALTSAPPPGAPACAVLAGSLRPPERAASILYDRPAMLDGGRPTCLALVPQRGGRLAGAALRDNAPPKGQLGHQAGSRSSSNCRQGVRWNCL